MQDCLIKACPRSNPVKASLFRSGDSLGRLMQVRRFLKARAGGLSGVNAMRRDNCFLLVQRGGPESADLPDSRSAKVQVYGVATITKCGDRQDLRIFGLHTILIRYARDPVRKIAKILSML